MADEKSVNVSATVTFFQKRVTEAFSKRNNLVDMLKEVRDSIDLCIRAAEGDKAAQAELEQCQS